MRLILATGKMLVEPPGRETAAKRLTPWLSVTIGSGNDVGRTDGELLPEPVKLTMPFVRVAVIGQDRFEFQEVTQVLNLVQMDPHIVVQKDFPDFFYIYRAAWIDVRELDCPEGDIATTRCVT